MAAAGDRGALSPDTSSESTATSGEGTAEERSPRRSVVRVATVVAIVALVVGVLAALAGAVAPRVLGDDEPAQVRDVLQRTEDFAPALERAQGVQGVRLLHLKTDVEAITAGTTLTQVAGRAG